MYKNTWPREVQDYAYDVDCTDRDLECSLTTLAQSTIQLIDGSVSFEIVFNDRRHHRAKPATHPEDLYFRAHQMEDADGYNVEARVDDGKFVDTAHYTVLRPEMPGYMAPYAIAVSSLSRTVYPQLYRTTFDVHNPTFGPKNSLRSVANTLSAIRQQRYGLHGIVTIK